MRRIYQNAWILLVVGLILIMYTANNTNLDLTLADYFFDFDQGRFPLKESWWARDIFHHWIKLCLMFSGASIVLITLIDGLRPLNSISAFLRIRLRIISLSAILVPLIISLLKHESALHCPWDIQRYGGNAPYLRLLEAIPTGWHNGQCFPSGHAGTGLWLAALACMYLPRQPKKAAVVFSCGLAVGLVLGWVQQMRGAHFLSHTLMSAWVASAIILVIFQCALD